MAKKPPEKTARRRRARGQRRGRRGLPLRKIGRRAVLFGAANAFTALLLPWFIVVGRGSLNAFGLAANPDLLEFLGAGWLAVAVWAVLGASVILVVLALIDGRRSTGLALPLSAIAAGLACLSVSGYVFASVEVLRQFGAIALGVAGIVFTAGGAILVRAPWEAPAAGRRSVLTEPRRLPWVTIALVAANVLAHLALAFREDYYTGIVRDLGLIGGSLRAYAFLTHMFLHANWLHIVTNLAVLVSVGTAVERRVGRAVFLLVYLVSGLAGAAVSIVLDPRIHIPFIGASGAVAGVMGLCLATAPQAELDLWFHAGVAAGKVRVRAAWIFSAWIALQAVGVLYLSADAPSSTGYWGHMGGVVLGLAAGGILRALGRARGPAESAESESRGRRRALRRERAAFRHFPHALIAVSLLVSAFAAAIRFGPGSMFGTLASFQRVWNTGDLAEVAHFFPEDSRDEYGRYLRKIIARLDPDAPGGRTTYTIALTQVLRRDGECDAIYARGPQGKDPFRGDSDGSIQIFIRRESGAWVVRGVSSSPVRAERPPGPDP